MLDLYAGSGALGLEAASRGAVDVVLVESARAAAEVCRRNAATLGLGVVRVVQLRVSAFLRQAQGPVDLVFLDPPYDLPEPELTEALAGVAGVVAPGGVVVVERGVRTPEPTWPSGVVRTDERRYGDTAMWFAEASRQAPEPGSAGPAPA